MTAKYLRRVDVLKYENGAKVFSHKAFFHTFSSCYEEFQNGPGNYGVAIVEKEDGQVEMVNADYIKFTDIHVPCKGRNCGTTRGNFHSPECIADYNKACGE